MLLGAQKQLGGNRPRPQRARLRRRAAAAAAARPLIRRAALLLPLLACQRLQAALQPGRRVEQAALGRGRLRHARAAAVGVDCRGVVGAALAILKWAARLKHHLLAAVPLLRE